MACDRCYTLTGYIGSGFCGCSNCDKCNRCCGVPPNCDSVTIEWTIAVQGSEPPYIYSCCAGRNLPIYENKNNNVYNQFFELLKKYNKKDENKNIAFQSNPLEMKFFEKIKFKKQKNENISFDFFSKINKNDKKWKYYREKDNSCVGENYNFAYWTGTNWIFLKNKNNFCFDKINCKKPFYVIFNDFLEIIKTNNDFFDLKLKNICLSHKNNFIVTSDVLKAQNNKMNYLNDNNISLISELVDCTLPQTGYCYSFTSTFTRTGSGCGFCRDRIRQPTCWYSIGTVGGGKINTTQYSDQWIDRVVIYEPKLLDGFSIQLGIKTTLCGSLAVSDVTAKIISSCPLCHFNSNKLLKSFRHNSDYQKKLIEKRRQNRNVLNGKKLKKFI